MNDNAALAPPNPFLSTMLDWLHDLPPAGPVDDRSSGDRLASWRQLACAGMTEEHLQALFLLRLARWACPESPQLDGDPMDRWEAVPEPIIVTPLGRQVIARLIEADNHDLPALRPHWQSQTRQLWYGQRLVKAFRRHAPLQMMLLDAFQRAGWPAWMASPFPRDPYDDDEVRMLLDTIKNANYGHRYRLLRFRTDIHHRRVGWRLLPTKS